MGRPRLTDTDLPENVYLRRGRYFLVRRGAWLNLGTDRQQVLLVAAALGAGMKPGQRDVMAYALKKVAVARANAKRRRQLSFTLEKQDVQAMMLRQRFRCAVTGMPFALSKHGLDRPFAPSIDRIQCGEGYTAENCRLVCVATNFAINRWGEGVLRTLALAMSGKVLDMSKTNLDVAA